MAHPDQLTRASGNRLLAALPPKDFARIAPLLEAVQLPLRHTLYPAEEPITTVHFVETGFVSLLAYSEDGSALEVGVVGCEGMVGMPLVFGDNSDDCEAMVQNSGTALRMDAAAFREEVNHTSAFRTLVLRAALFQHRQVARTAVCNGRHTTDQRLARWLLVAHDRSEGDAFPITHEFLANMLGVRRAGVTVAAGQLQDAGLIRYERGQVEVTDRAGLEARTCECYGVTRRALDRLLGADAVKGDLRCQ
jgi:CRP-like cAMP-binding protein